MKPNHSVNLILAYGKVRLMYTYPLKSDLCKKFWRHAARPGELDIADDQSMMGHVA